MTEEPERIWLKEERSMIPHHEEGPFNESSEGDGAEYVRADLYDALAAERDALRDLLVEARCDLAQYVELDWPGDRRATYPSYQRKWERDMELCRRIDAALGDAP